MVPHQGIMALNHRNTKINIQKFFLQNCWAQMLDIWYVAWPSGLYIFFFQIVATGSKMAPHQGVMSVNLRNT